MRNAKLINMKNLLVPFFLLLKQKQNSDTLVNKLVILRPLAVSRTISSLLDITYRFLYIIVMT